MYPCANNCARLGLTVAALVIACAFLTGCCDVCPPVTERMICPPVKHYTPEEQLAMKMEFDKMPSNSTIKQAFIDYGVERKALNACRDGG